jgi:hypothetical protein
LSQLSGGVNSRRPAIFLTNIYWRIDVTEVDGGTLGQDDQGHSTLTFDLTPTMGVSRKAAAIKLNRPNMQFLGKVEVTLTAQRI